MKSYTDHDKPNKNHVVLHIMGPLRFSGMERMFLSSATIWEQGGWSPIIVGQGKEHPFAQKLIDAGYSLKFVRTLRSFFGLLDLVKVLFKTRPSVVHIHTESMNGAVAILIRVFMPRMRIIRTIHSDFVFTGFAKRKRQIQHSLSKLAGVIHISVSSYVAFNELNNYGINSRIIENWISDDFFVISEKVMRVHSDRILLGIVGNCSEIKNHSVVLDAVKRIPNISLIHLGDSEKASKLEKILLEDLENSDQILSIGVREDIANTLRSCDLFAMPSLREGFGVALAEALALGIPCLISNTEGLSWARGLPGVEIVEKHEDWIEVLKNMNSAKIAALQSEAELNREKYRIRFGPERGVQEYIEVYSN